MTQELINKIIDWGRERSIDNPKAQMTKVIEEYSEMNTSIWENKVQEEIIDAIGDLQVTLIILADTMGNTITPDQPELRSTLPNILESISTLNRYIANESYGFAQKMIDQLWTMVRQLSRKVGYDPDECLQFAYNEIKNREGETINGVFVKEQ